MGFGLAAALVASVTAAFAVGGIWFIIGPVISKLWQVGGPAAPIGAPAGPQVLQVLEQIGYFYGLGALVTALAGIALGRMMTRAV